VSSFSGRLKTGNPAFTMASGTIFDDWARADRRPTTMTVAGTAYKALALLAILTACAAVSWTRIQDGRMSQGLFFGSMIAGMIVGFATILKPAWAPVTAPIYAACEGFLLGAISLFFDAAYKGLVVQAVGLTFGVLFLMLFLYSSKLIRVTDRLRIAVVSATGAVFLFYMITWLLSLFGFGMARSILYGNGVLGIGLSVVVVGIAAFNLLLDFDFIEQRARYGAPKAMEWYGAFGLMVTLIWLYLEILRLLAKLQSNRD
jgi:uncharacterized YccA/Bax inhibitor family protein